MIVQHDGKPENDRDEDRDRQSVTEEEREQRQFSGGWAGGDSLPPLRGVGLEVPGVIKCCWSEHESAAAYKSAAPPQLGVAAGSHLEEALEAVGEVGVVDVVGGEVAEEGVERMPD